MIAAAWYSDLSFASVTSFALIKKIAPVAGKHIIMVNTTVHVVIPPQNLVHMLNIKMPTKMNTAPTAIAI